MEVHEAVVVDEQKGNPEPPAKLPEAIGGELHLVAEPGLVDPSQAPAEAEGHTLALLAHGWPNAL